MIHILHDNLEKLVVREPIAAPLGNGRAGGRPSPLRRVAQAALAFVLLAPAVRAVHASTSQGERMAATFSSFDALLGAAETVHVNGLTVHRASLDVPVDAHAALDVAESACEAGATPESTLFAQEASKRMPAAPERARRALDALTRGVLRSEDDESGTLICFAPMGAERASFWDRVREVATTGQLGALGAFRYVSVTAGSASKSHVTAHWSTERADPARLFPEQGDAPGDDSPDVPRPPRGRRLLTARAAGLAHAVHVYETNETLTLLHEHYERALARPGLKAIAQNDARALAYLREDLGMVLVVLQEQGTARTVTVVETGAPGYGPSSR